MNIVKMQDMLKGVPENALIGYVQNPGQVPSYLALGELQRRKKMREEAAVQAQAPQQSVAEQMVSQAQPQPMDMGVASLPAAESVGNEEAYAQGGIIGFAEGGDLGFEMLNEFRESQGLPPLTKEQYYAQPAPSRNVDGSYESPYLPKEAPWVTDWRRTVPNMWEPPKYNFKQPSEAKKPAEKPKKEEAKAAAPTAPSVAPPAKQPSVPAREPSGIATARAMNKEIARQKAGQSAPAQATGLATLYSRDIPFDESVYAEIPEIGAKGHMQSWRDLVGEDPGRAGLNERMAKLESRAAETERMAPWQAMTMAGLATAAGDSQYWAQNLGKGVMVGVQDYSKSRDKLQELEEKRFEMAQKMSAADRAETIAAAKYGVDSDQADKERNDKRRLQKQADKLNVQIKNESNRLEAAKANLSADLDLRKMAQQREIAEMESRDRREATAATRAGYARLSDYETYLEGAKQDPANYKVVKGADGKDQRIFDIQKVNRQYREDAAYGSIYGADARNEIAKEGKYNEWAKANPGVVIKMQREGKDPRAYWEANVFKGGTGAASYGAPPPGAVQRID